MKTNQGTGAAPISRDEEKKLQKEGLKREHTHPNEDKAESNLDPNGMTAKTLGEMKKKLDQVPSKSAATENDKDAYGKE